MPPSRSYRNRCWPQSRSPDEIRGSGAAKVPDCIRATVLIAGRGSGFSRECHRAGNRFAAKAECRPAVPTDSVADGNCVARMKLGSRPHKGPGLHPGYGIDCGRGSGFSRDCHRAGNRFAAKAECRPAVPTDSVAGRNRVAQMKSEGADVAKAQDCIRATNPDFWNYAQAESKNLDKIQKTGQLLISGTTALRSAKTPVNPWA